MKSSFLDVIGFLPYTSFLMKLPTTKVSSFTSKSFILVEAGFKYFYSLTYFEVESPNAQFLCHFTFSFLKFRIIPSLSCKWTRIPTGKGISFLWYSSMLFSSLTYQQTVLFLLWEGLSQGAIRCFWHNMQLPQSICPVQS